MVLPTGPDPPATATTPIVKWIEFCRLDLSLNFGEKSSCRIPGVRGRDLKYLKSKAAVDEIWSLVELEYGGSMYQKQSPLIRFFGPTLVIEAGRS